MCIRNRLASLFSVRYCRDFSSCVVLFCFVLCFVLFFFTIPASSLVKVAVGNATTTPQSFHARDEESDTKWKENGIGKNSSCLVYWAQALHLATEEENSFPRGKAAFAWLRAFESPSGQARSQQGLEKSWGDRWQRPLWEYREVSVKTSSK